MKTTSSGLRAERWSATQEDSKQITNLPATGTINTLNEQRQPSRSRATLSPRRLEVAQLVAAGLSDKEIANRLHLSDGTIGSYLKTIFRRYGVHKRTALAKTFLLERRGVEGDNCPGSLPTNVGIAS